MSQSYKYGLIVHRHKKEVNIGDYIQAIAVKQALGVDDFVLFDREDLANYKGEPLRMVGQGWYCHGEGAWPPASQIDYLPLGIHINPQSHTHFLKPTSMEALNRLAPIGCRDMLTYEFLQQHNVNSYFSGCMTVTLQPSNIPRKPEKIYLIDVGRAAIKLLPKHMQDLPVVELSHLLPHPEGRVWEHDELFKIAQERLDLYYSTAAVVITSRIHALMPCMAMGIPCLWIERRLLDKRLYLARRYAYPHFLPCPDRFSPKVRMRIERYLHPVIVAIYNLFGFGQKSRLNPRLDMSLERERILNALNKAKEKLNW